MYILIFYFLTDENNISFTSMIVCLSHSTPHDVPLIRIDWDVLISVVLPNLSPINPFLGNNEITRLGPWQQQQQKGISHGFWEKLTISIVSFLGTFDEQKNTMVYRNEFFEKNEYVHSVFNFE